MDGLYAFGEPKLTIGMLAVRPDTPTSLSVLGLLTGGSLGDRLIEESSAVLQSGRNAAGGGAMRQLKQHRRANAGQTILRRCVWCCTLVFCTDVSFERQYGVCCKMHRAFDPPGHFVRSRIVNIVGDACLNTSRLYVACMLVFCT